LVTNPITHQKILYNSTELINPNNPNSPGLNNAGKVVSGTDRLGDKWVITVHGPGEVIVTDTTPNDGALDDDINTIQLVGTNPKTTYVTGNVIPSNTLPTGDLVTLFPVDISGDPDSFTAEPSSGIIKFNQLIDVSGVQSIELNGFSLNRNVSPAVTTATGIFLYGGVGTLSFDNITAELDTSVNSTPYQIVIGDPANPMKVQPQIFINHVYNLVFDGATETTPPTTPVTSPSVQFIINGFVRDFELIAATQPVVPAGEQFIFPPIGTTGQTSVQAAAINNLSFAGSAKNVTISRSTVPFSSESSGLNYLKKGTFGGNADGVAIDVKGKIGKLTFKRGLGNPAYTFTGKSQNGLLVPTTLYGTPTPATGYPSGGFLGGEIHAASIKKLTVKPANQLVQTAQNPDFVQSQIQGYPTYVASPGYSLTNAVITTSGSIGQVNVTGTPLNSEIKSGFDFVSYLAGLEGTRNPSQISALTVLGDLVNTDASATFRPTDNHYDIVTGTAGPGAIEKRISGKNYDTGGVTGLGNTGAGVFARVITKLGPKPRVEVGRGGMIRVEK
jgi:hypothetical protein